MGGCQDPDLSTGTLRPQGDGGPGPARRSSPVPRQKIAERQEISADHAAQLFRHLQSAGPVACVVGGLGGEPPCNRVDRCVAHLLWKRLSDPMTDILDSVTLRQLADQAQDLGGWRIGRTVRRLLFGQGG